MDGVEERLGALERQLSELAAKHAELEARTFSHARILDQTMTTLATTVTSFESILDAYIGIPLLVNGTERGRRRFKSNLRAATDALNDLIKVVEDETREG